MTVPVDANLIPLLRQASAPFSYVDFSGVWDLDILRQCLPPSKPIQAFPKVDISRPVHWFKDLSTLCYVTSTFGDDFYGGYEEPGSFLLQLEHLTSLCHIELKCKAAPTNFEHDTLFATLATCPIETLI
ncbi:hypothetical protein H257_02593 [Aphanomyces astaci]|uniref:Uncharacterized protein n=1 Tax=Aphanomyces astaci TaxID=112090 RepID=W4H3H0_APHAT|nr:hypothetical protein H257_02593 [Aphanomyces astaci]ETV86131.1 hypothetical protein H257_02593 [Aphanomyces astaci]|eukprot:XP_009824603.1 hypothetical protein H257_02593 [Aphanomyces astaci]